MWFNGSFMNKYNMRMEQTA